jgi:hypothetical protein
VLSILIRGVLSAGAGSFETNLVAVALGSWSLGTEEIRGLNSDRAAWGLERIATQNLALTLDAALEDRVPNRLKHPDPCTRDFFCFVRCLRNAFAHDPYHPTWDLRSEALYRRELRVLDNWVVDLTARNGTDVKQEDYRYAGGLLRLCDRGRDLIAALSRGA